MLRPNSIEVLTVHLYSLFSFHCGTIICRVIGQESTKTLRTCVLVCMSPVSMGRYSVVSVWLTLFSFSSKFCAHHTYWNV